MRGFTSAIPFSVFCLVLVGRVAGQTADSPATQPVNYVVDSSGQRAQPAVAIDQVCPFPFAEIAADGTIYAIIFNQPSHGRLPGDVDCYSSAEGTTWTKRGTPAAHEPGTMTNRMNKAFGLLPNGNLMVLCSGWNLIERPNQLGSLDVDQQLTPIQSVSSDGGRTWDVTTNFPANAPAGLSHIPWGKIQAGQDGALRAVTYEFDKATKWRTVRIWRSADDGKTWGDPVMLDPERRINETYPLHLGNGRWIAVVREANLDLYESTDDAKTWRRVGPVTEPAAYPGTLLRLKDDRILLSNGNRTKGEERCEVRISTDEGRTFSPPVRLLDFIGFDGGYPCSVQRADGQIITVYYAKKTTYHDGYHMGVVIWDPAKTFPKQ